MGGSELQVKPDPVDRYLFTGANLSLVFEKIGNAHLMAPVRCIGGCGAI
jgi:hypothetical protein